MAIWHIFRNRRQREKELEEEIESHLRLAAGERVERGESVQIAGSDARREFGNVGLIAEVTRDMWGWGVAERLMQDVRYAGRVLRKSPGFMVVAVLSIALGIGANTAIFSLIDAVLLKSLPVRDPGSLVSVGDSTRTSSLSQGQGRADLFAFPFFERFKARNRSFTDVYATGRSEQLDVSVANGPKNGSKEENTRGRFVTGNYFSVLGVPALLGRVFTGREVRVPGSSPVVVISFGYWERQFGRDPAVIGKKLQINGAKFTIIGVTPPEFSGDIVGTPMDLWLPMTMQAQANPGHNYLKNSGVSWLLLVGRLRPGVSMGEARGEVQVLGRQIFTELYKSAQPAEEFQGLLKQKIEVASSARGLSRLRKQFSKPLMILLCIVGMVLLICCANVANLQLARAASKGREMGLRLAIGAGTTRLVRQLLTESLLVAGAGGVVGLVFALLGSHLLLRLVAGRERLPLTVSVDGPMLLFTAGVAILAGLLFGLAPALQTTRLDLVSSLKESKSGQPPGFAQGFGKTLIVSQIVFSMLLLVGAGLFIRTLRNLETVDVGYSRSGLVLVQLDHKAAGYGDKDVHRLARNLLEKMGAVPGVKSVTVSENGLFSGTDSETNAVVEGFSSRRIEDKANRSDRVGPGYFETVGTPILLGRGIEAQDGENAPKVAVLNEKMAQFYFRHQNPIGMHIFDGEGAKRIAITIVGVVRDVKQSDLRDATPRRFYTAFWQHDPDDEISGLNLEVRTKGLPSSAVLNQLPPAIKSVNANLPILSLKSADELIGGELEQERLVAKLSSFFGLLALGLSAIGLFGVMSYLTVRRRMEIGIRMALGAERFRVVGMVLGESFRLVALGVVIGLALSLLEASILQKSLFGLSPFDPVTLIMAAGVIAATAGLATYWPAWRASRIDPMVALRYE